MDELNEFETYLDDLENKRMDNLLDKVKKIDDRIEVTYSNENELSRCTFYYFEIDKALDFFNEKKREGYQVAMRKVEE